MMTLIYRGSEILEVIEGEIVISEEKSEYVHVENIEDFSAAVAVKVRAKRSSLLSACDWTQVQDAPVDKEVWKAYRQALRDITKQSEFPFNVVWPTEP